MKKVLLSAALIAMLFGSVYSANKSHLAGTVKLKSELSASSQSYTDPVVIGDDDDEDDDGDGTGYSTSTSTRRTTSSKKVTKTTKKTTSATRTIE